MSREGNIKHSRFKDAPWYTKKAIDVLVGGAGGIGSWLTVLLARAGFNPIVYDFDILEEHNLAGQFYPKSAITKTKVNALHDLVLNFCDTDITVMDEAYSKDSFSGDFVFSGFDNMKARADMFENWVEKVVNPYLEELKMISELEKDLEIESPIEPIYIDGRLLAEQLQIFCVTPDNIDKYRAHLFDDSEVEEASCTFKQTSHSAAMIAAHMVGFFTNHITNITVGKERNIPFFWEYFIPIDFLTIREE